ncbi:MAG: chromosomal replication initiator protein DnaA [Lachnospiraceae bacterium]|nr:chromosomal replication initiator protein DnaA [Lachnospiraceae bacterium]
MCVNEWRVTLDKNTIWGATINFLKDTNTDLSYNTWLAPLNIHHIEEDAGIIYLAWPNQAKLINHINDHYLAQIENAINSSTEKKYRVVIKQEKEYEISKVDTSRMSNPFKQEKLFNPRFNFENFVVGNSNKYAHAVSVAVAESPGDIYNPLFIYGGSGLGKTHLMQSIGVQIIRNNPQAKVLYVSSEMFTNEFITAIKDGKSRAFRNKYRRLDVLLIDDIQFLEGKEQTQEEFFHTFEALYNNNKQIVITSDCPPVELKGLGERLRTRFSWNMIADIQPPDYETRVAILRSLAEKSDIEITSNVNDVINLIADQVRDNIRELEGAYNRVIGLSQLLDEPINVDNARNILKDIIKDNEQAVAPERIRSIVASQYKIKVADMDSPKRNAEITLPRQVAMYMCREVTELSLPKIGKLFGNRHYSTVIHAIDKIEEQLKYDEALYESVETIRAKLDSRR